MLLVSNRMWCVMSIQPDTITIPLTRGYSTVIDAVDADLSEFKWCATVGIYGKPYAARRGMGRSNERIHRTILSRALGRPLTSAELTDHIDGDTLNNRRANLRLVTPAQNSANKGIRSDNTTGFRGVYPTGYKDPMRQFKAAIRSTVIGCYPTAEMAAAAYANAATELYGEFSPLLSRQDKT